MSGFFLDPRGGIDKTIPHVPQLRHLIGWGADLYVFRFRGRLVEPPWVAEKGFVHNYVRNFSGPGGSSSLQLNGMVVRATRARSV